MSSRTETVISINGLAKSYQVFDSPLHRLKQLVLGKRHSGSANFDALKPLSLRIEAGDVVGIVGRNGSGKSTLLQMVCGTLTPSQGSITVRGKIAALLELGAGFNPDFTGRENVYLSGALMGIGRKTLDAKIEEILSFSGIGDFIDRPVKTYSSGMFVRLAFAVATSTEPEVLVIDEALSVGDGAFAKRSFDRIMAMKDAGKTILFCSHSLYQVETICNKVLWLDRGEVRSFGAPEEVVPRYEAFLEALDNPQGVTTKTESEPSIQSSIAGSQPKIRNIDVRVPTNANPESLHLISGESDLEVEVKLTVPDRDKLPGVAVVVHNEAGALVTSCGSWEDGFSLQLDSFDHAQICLRFERVPLLKGRYRLGVILFCDRGIYPYEEVDPVLFFEVSQTSAARGVVALNRSWRNIGTDRWQVRTADGLDREALSKLYEQCFGQVCDKALWDWKYGGHPSICRGVFDHEQLVAFVGVTTRRVQVDGGEIEVAQLGDVMVRPESRGVLVKRGPFYRGTAAFLNASVGEGKRFPYAFGFPHRRACKVGERLGLYTPIDKVHKAIWEVAHHDARANTDFNWVERPASEAEVDYLWSEMSSCIDDAVVGVRDWAWYNHRYLAHPTIDYRTKLMFSTGGEVLGLAVLKIDGPELVLLDYIGRPDQLETLLKLLKQDCFEAGLVAVTCWLSSQSLLWFGTQSTVLEDIDVTVPGSAYGGVEQAQHLKGRWWLMGGDTDFL